MSEFTSIWAEPIRADTGMMLRNGRRCCPNVSASYQLKNDSNQKCDNPRCRESRTIHPLLEVFLPQLRNSQIPPRRAQPPRFARDIS